MFDEGARMNELPENTFFKFSFCCLMDPHSGNTTILKDTQVLEHASSLTPLPPHFLILWPLKVYGGSPIYKCLHSETQLSVPAHLLLRGLGCKKVKENIKFGKIYNNKKKKTKSVLPSVFVRNGFWLLFVYLMKQRSEYPPCFSQFITAHNSSLINVRKNRKRNCRWNSETELCAVM